MDDRGLQFRVGILVVATLIIAAILVERFGDLPGIKKNQYTIYIRFPQAPGVTVDTPVLKSGILVGRVSRVTLLDDGGVVVTTKIDADRQLKNNEICRISTGSILGDAILEFVPSNTAQPSREAYRDGEYLDGIVAQDPLRVMESATTVLEMLSTLEKDVRLALVSIEGAGKSVGDVAESMTSIMDNNQNQVRRVLGKAESAMDRFDEAASTVSQLAESLDDIVGSEDVQIAIEQSLNEIPELFADAREVLDTLQSASARAEQNFKNIEGLTEPLGLRGQEFTTSIDKSLTDIQKVLTQLVQFSTALNNREGTLGQLLHDRELYDQINSSVSNIEHLTNRLRPVIEDARVFTDKIARDPGRLGVQAPSIDASRARSGRCFGASVLRCFGASVLRCFGASVLRCFGASVLRCFGASVLRCFGASVLRCFGASVTTLFGALKRSVIAKCKMQIANCKLQIVNCEFRRAAVLNAKPRTLFALSTLHFALST